MNIPSLVGGQVAPALTAVITAATGGSGAKGPAALAGILPGATFLERLLGPNRASAQHRAEELGALLTRFLRGALAGDAASTKATSTKSSSSSSNGSLSFLKDPKLSVEEKLARLMVYLSDKYEKQLEQKLQQYADLENGKATGSSSSQKSSGSSSASSSPASGLSDLFSKGGLSGLFQGGGLQDLLGQVAGPVLAGAATAFGMPSLAPMLLKAGPLLGSFAGGALSALTSGGGGSTAATASSGGSSSKSTSSSGSSGSSGETSEKQIMTEIQILQEKAKEMFTLVSNILRAQHDTKMAVLSNVR